jgi:hypothetical protein
VTMGFADTRHLRQTAPVPRLGLRARWRAVQETRGTLLDLAERLRALVTLDAHGPRS